MKFAQAFKMAFKSIGGNKARSFLTMLGIIIGVASVMTIVSVMMAQNKASLEQLKAMGTNRLEVYAYLYNGNSVFDDLYDYCLYLDQYVDGVTPMGNYYGNVTYGNKSGNAMEYPPQVYFGSDQYSIVNNFQLAEGRDLSKIDVDNYSNVCVLGARAARNFFDFTDPVDKEIQIDGVPFRVVGVYAEKDPNNDYSLDNVIVLPYTTSRSLSQYVDMSQFYVKCKDGNAVRQAQAMIEGFLTGICGDPNDWNNQRGYFYTNNPDQYTETINEQAKSMSLVLGGIAGISLLVGGIGIMNIMLVTVTERTKEIGIRRAIGAERKSIVTQFLIEAGMICGIGGMIGAAFGFLFTMLGGKLFLHLKTILLPSFGVTLGAVVFSVVLGIIFGMYPAIKASGLQPVVALRAE